MSVPVITTPRLTLGGFSMPHFEAFDAFCATERSAYLGGPSTDRRDSWGSCMIHLGHWQARGYGAFFATETATGRPAGRFSLWHPVWLDEPELSWLVYDGFEGKGLAAEGAAAVRNWAAGHGHGPLVSLIAPDNARSIALAERLGARAEGTHTYDHGGVVLKYRHPPGEVAA